MNKSNFQIGDMIEYRQYHFEDSLFGIIVKITPHQTLEIKDFKIDFVTSEEPILLFVCYY
jgi:hypothetical protein